MMSYLHTKFHENRISCFIGVVKTSLLGRLLVLLPPLATQVETLPTLAQNFNQEGKSESAFIMTYGEQVVQKRANFEFHEIFSFTVILRGFCETISLEDF